MTATTYDRNSLSIPTQLPLDGRNANLALQGVAQSSVKVIKEGLKSLLVLAFFTAIMAGTLGLKAAIVMSRFNYIN